ncbi:EAL domain-containing protein [Bacillus benzoevorans]|uniref:Diguanylate cyclase (GGDEF)-like protein n=1 Tax=Bacillus benzoevorans TaxID=1456 RepID=A0A7X0HVW0_9BACI|nr:EAL domain-containing protein [Bacillus benzoevorans]MBB6446897.1 diguanylate cyclase (GGDEF)-like protein [Bacillus benzoevorans]
MPLVEAEKVNILLVDDRPENLLALEAIIERDDYQLIKASSGEEALKYLLKYDFAAILLDVQMPGMDGFGTAKIIKAREKTKNIPILFITANSMDAEHVFMGYSVGAIDYITKPFDPIILKAKVDGFVEIYRMKLQLMHQADALVERNRIIEHMAFHDGLTDLPNRRLFHDKLLSHINHAKNMHQPLAMLYLDLDRFKYVNDSLGHIVGDRLLQKAAQRLAGSVRKDDFVARVGGDEFNIMLPDTDREQALEVAENIINAFKEPFLINNYELYITTSIGLSIFPYDGEDLFTIVKNADTALYRAKEQGKNKYTIYHSGMDLQSYQTFLLQNDLYKAVEREELTIVYQPRVDVESGRVTSAEALLRWNHSKWGTVSPGQFIPIAEETGQIVKISEWVLKKVCEQINLWKKSGFTPVPVAINFSAQQFLHKNLTEHIREILTETQVDPQLLEFDITETVILGNEQMITETLQQLRKMKIKISLDDFGTGYSSLNCLRLFPYDTIKIDQSFVRDLSAQNHECLAIIETITSLAKNLKMSVIAEGVETEEQLNMIKLYHCQQFQGYLFSPPVLAKDFERFLANGNQIESKPLNPDRVQGSMKEWGFYQSQDKILRQEIQEGAILYIKREYGISSRELDVFKLIIDGLSNKEISEKLFISEHTVKNHITHILQKLKVTDRVQAMALVYDTCIKEGERLFN